MSLMAPQPVSVAARDVSEAVSSSAPRDAGATQVEGMPMRINEQIRRRASWFGALALAVAVLALAGCTSGGAAAPTATPATATPTPPPSARAYAGVFTPTGDLTPARVGGTATLLSDGRALIAGGWDNSRGSNTTLASTELYDPASGTFTPTGDLIAARVNHTATLLSDGRVLIAGGHSGSSILDSTELYDPATGTSTPTGKMETTREGHTATLLPNGRVLVAGGLGGSSRSVLASAELYDPASGIFTATADLATARTNHTATLLRDGRVLMAGGSDGDGALASAELYDPTRGTFTPTGDLAAARYTHTATLLADGRVLVAGGFDGRRSVGGGYASGLLASAELYDPKTGAFTPTADLAAARHAHTATLLSDGRVLVAGGIGGPAGSALASAEIYQ